MATTTKEVRDALTAAIDNIETNNSDLAEGVRAAVPNDEIGQFWAVVREEDLEVSAKRMGDTLVAHIEAEEEEGLGALFG